MNAENRKEIKLRNIIEIQKIKFKQWVTAYWDLLEIEQYK